MAVLLTGAFCTDVTDVMSDEIDAILRTASTMLPSLDSSITPASPHNTERQRYLLLEQESPSECPNVDVRSTRAVSNCCDMIVKQSRVCLNDFQDDDTCVSSDLFTSNYLKDVTKKFEDPRKTYKYTISGVSIKRPPYSYSALIIAAFYLSGRTTLTFDDIRTYVTSMFPVFCDLPKKWYWRWHSGINQALGQTRMFVMTSSREWSMLPIFIYKSVMKKKVCLEYREDMHEFSEYLHEHLGYPDMIDVIRGNHGDDQSIQLESKVTDVNEEGETECEVTIGQKRPCDDDTIPMPTKRCRLQIPPRRCYHEDNTARQSGTNMFFSGLEPSLRDTWSSTEYENGKTPVS